MKTVYTDVAIVSHVLPEFQGQFSRIILSELHAVCKDHRDVEACFKRIAY